MVLETQGTIRAHHSTTITSLVPGTIHKVHPNFEDGAFFNKGDVLAELDPADLQAALTTTEILVVRDGLEPGAWLATSRLPYAPDGAPVEIIDPPVAVENPAKEAVTSGS